MIDKAKRGDRVTYRRIPFLLIFVVRAILPPTSTRKTTTNQSRKYRASAIVVAILSTLLISSARSFAVTNAVPLSRECCSMLSGGVCPLSNCACGYDACVPTFNSKGTLSCPQNDNRGSCHIDITENKRIMTIL